MMQQIDVAVAPSLGERTTLHPQRVASAPYWASRNARPMGATQHGGADGTLIPLNARADSPSNNLMMVLLAETRQFRSLLPAEEATGEQGANSIEEALWSALASSIELEPSTDANALDEAFALL